MTQPPVARGPATPNKKASSRPTAEQERALAVLLAQRVAQGLPPVIEDSQVLRRVASVLADTPVRKESAP
jgi:hypothetical protein